MRILIVDDDRELGEELAEILRGEGYDITLTADSWQAAQLIQHGAYDVYLLDYKMPCYTGIDLLKRIKNQIPAARVFMVSGRPFIENLLREASATALVEGIIKKPFTVETLLAMIRPKPGG